MTAPTLKLFAVSDSEILDWFELHGVSVDHVAAVEGMIRVVWHQGTAHGMSLREAIRKAMQQRAIMNDPDDEPTAGDCP